MFRPFPGTACALGLALGVASTSIGAAETTRDASDTKVAGVEPGASNELKLDLKREPSIWTVLSAQYQLPTTPS